MPLERRGNLWVSGVPLFELEPFAGGRTVTLRWLSDDVHLYQEVERQLHAVAQAFAAAGGRGECPEYHPSSAPR